MFVNIFSDDSHFLNFISESYAETDSHTEFKKREKSDSPSDFTKSTLMDEWRQNLNYHCPTEYDDINNINNVYNVSYRIGQRHV